MCNYKTVQIQILDINHENYQESITDLGCYYSLVKEESKFIDVTILADHSNSVIIPLTSSDAIISMTLKSLTDKTLVGNLQLPILQLLQQEEEFIQWFEIKQNQQVQMKLQLKFTLLKQEFQSPSPLKSSSLNNSQSQHYSISSQESDLKMNCHYVTMGQEFDCSSYPSQQLHFPISPTFRKMVDAGIQVESESQDPHKGRIEYEQMIGKYQQSQMALQQLQKECSEVLMNNNNNEQQIKMQGDEIQRLKSQLQNQQREYMILQNEKKTSSFDDALVDQIKKLKNTIKQMEDQNKLLKQQYDQLCQSNSQMQDSYENIKSQFELFVEKQQRNESILSLSDEQNKYILNLNQKLVAREREQNVIISQLSQQCEQWKSQLHYKECEVDKLRLNIKKEQLLHKILVDVAETKLNSYQVLFGEDDYLSQIRF